MVKGIRWLVSCGVLGTLGTVLTVPAQAQARLGQIIPLSGPLANVGKEINAATLAALAQHNKANKLQIELLAEDDGNDAARSAAAVRSLNGTVTGLVSCFGTVGCMGQMKAAQPFGLPLLGPIAGAAALRGKQAPYVFAVRASAKEELAKLLFFAQSAGLRQLAVVIQDDGFGQAYWSELNKAMEGTDLQVESSVLLKPGAPDYADVVNQLNKPTTKTLLLLANATHSVGILKAWRERNPLPFVMNLSGQANSLFANGLKGYVGAAAFVTVTPNPWGKKLNVQRDYQAAMQAANIANYSYLSFEAYINARLAIEAVKRSKNRSAAALKQALDSESFALGGLNLEFGDKATARFTDLSLLRADGTFMH